MIKAPEYLNIQTVSDVYKSINECDDETIEIDFSDTVSVDASAIQLLLMTQKFCDKHDKKLIITNDDSAHIVNLAKALCAEDIIECHS